jgi:hypothetical protein
MFFLKNLALVAASSATDMHLYGNPEDYPNVIEWTDNFYIYNLANVGHYRHAIDSTMGAVAEAVHRELTEYRRLTPSGIHSSWKEYGNGNSRTLHYKITFDLSEDDRQILARKIPVSYFRDRLVVIMKQALENGISRFGSFTKPWFFSTWFIVGMSVFVFALCGACIATVFICDQKRQKNGLKVYPVVQLQPQAYITARAHPI